MSKSTIPDLPTRQLRALIASGNPADVEIATAELARRHGEAPAAAVATKPTTRPAAPAKPKRKGSK